VCVCVCVNKEKKGSKQQTKEEKQLIATLMKVSFASAQQHSDLQRTMEACHMHTHTHTHLHAYIKR